jgi:nucleotide-binding universal stress UspA family protein
MTETNDGHNGILVAQDGSPAALAAAGVAIQIARGQEWPVHGLYVVDEALALNTYADFHDELHGGSQPASRAELLSWFEAQGESALGLLEARCRAAGVPVSTEMLAGGVPQMILRESEQAGLLALGRRGHSHEDDAPHLGHTFQNIAHHVHLPMVVGGDEEQTVHRLLLAYDGSDHARDALSWAASLQSVLPAEVVVLAVQEEGQPGVDACLTEAQEQLAGCQCLSRQGQAADEIVQAADLEAVDLIVMGRYRHAALREWLTGSTVDQVLRGTGLPVLVA